MLAALQSGRQVEPRSAEIWGNPPPTHTKEGRLDSEHSGIPEKASGCLKEPVFSIVCVFGMIMSGSRGKTDNVLSQNICYGNGDSGVESFLRAKAN